MSVQLRFLISAFLFVCTPQYSWAEDCSKYLHVRGQKYAKEQIDHIAKRYGVNENEIKFTSKAKYPVIIRGTGKETLFPKVDLSKVVNSTEEYDVIIVGGGPAGMTSALYLTDKGKKVLLIEREAKLGGLGAGTKLKGIKAGGGAAYSAGPDGSKQYKIFQHIGLGKYKKHLSIYEPIDSYFWKGKMYLGVWEEHTLKELPASFALFKHMLELSTEKGMFDATTTLGQQTDKIDFATLVRDMPNMISKLDDKKSKQIYQRFLTDLNVNRADPMKDVLELLELYGRSALGGGPEQISARQFGDFYGSELTTRYTGTLGTGTVTEAIEKKLLEEGRNITIKTSSPVAQINESTSTVIYVDNGQAIKVKGKKIVFSSPITLAPKIIDNFENIAADRLNVIKNIKMTDYAVHVVRVKGHPFRETYDLWIRPDDYTLSDPTDIILGRWMDKKIKGYKGMRTFKKNPHDDYGVLSVYHPLGPSEKLKNFGDDDVLNLAEQGVDRMMQILPPYLKKKFGTEINIELVESYRWPYSIHIVRPGYLEDAKLLSKPLGNIHFANNTLGAPELEEALERGFDAAQEILKDLRKISREKRIRGLDSYQEPPLSSRSLIDGRIH